MLVTSWPPNPSLGPARPLLSLVSYHENLTSSCNLVPKQLCTLCINQRSANLAGLRLHWSELPLHTAEEDLRLPRRRGSPPWRATMQRWDTAAARPLLENLPLNTAPSPSQKTRTDRKSAGPFENINLSPDNFRKENYTKVISRNDLEPVITKPRTTIPLSDARVDTAHQKITTS